MRRPGRPIRPASATAKLQSNVQGSGGLDEGRPATAVAGLHGHGHPPGPSGDQGGRSSSQAAKPSSRLFGRQAEDEFFKV